MGGKRGATVKVLIVEDDPDVVDLVRECVNARWHRSEVVAVGEGVKALATAKSEPADIVILDIGLPDIDGWEVLRRLREFSDVPVLILTGLNRDEDFAMFLKGEADEYLSKPFSADAFFNSVEAPLSRARKLKLDSESKPGSD
jgi:DNA-binding response OmpR family regulator